MLRLFINDRFQPYTFTVIIITVIFSLWIIYDIPLPPAINIVALANIFITVVSIFVWFLWVALTLIYQNQQGSNLQMLKANNKYILLISYFKQAIIWSLISICFWVFVSLGICINWAIFLSLITINLLVTLLNYRIIHFLFKILES